MIGSFSSIKMYPFKADLPTFDIRNIFLMTFLLYAFMAYFED